MAADFPKSFKDPLYASLDAGTEQKLGLPVGLLSSVRTHGERSNHDAVSSAGATTVYQFTPATRKAILNKYGIDVTLSPQNASEGAGLLLKEGLDRNQGDLAAAVGEYVGGLDRKEWGNVTKSYVNRVMVGQKQAKDTALDNAFSQWMAANPAVPAGRDASAIPTQQPAKPAEDKPDPLADAFGKWLDSSKALPSQAIDAYAAGTLPPEEMQRIKAGVADGSIKLPPGVSLGNTSAVGRIPGIDPNVQLSQPAPEPSLGDKVIGTGEMLASLGTGMVGGTVGMAGGMVKGMAQAILDGSYGTKQAADMVEQEAMKGADALTYHPRTDAGQQITDAAGKIMAESVPVAAILHTLPPVMMGARGAPAAVMARAGVEGTARDAANLAAKPAEAAGIVAPGAAGDAARSVVASIEPTMAKVREASQPIIDKMQPNKAPDVTPSGQPVQLSPEEIARAAKSASEGGIGSSKAADVLAKQASPSPEIVKSAERLGIQDYLQPDHTTTNDAYRQVVGVIKSANPGSELATSERIGLENVGRRATDLIDEIGGTTDYGNLDKNVKSRMQGIQAELDARADSLYEKLRQEIPQKADAPATSVLDFIKKRSDELGGKQNLTPTEKMILSKLSPKVASAQETATTAVPPSDFVTPSQLMKQRDTASQRGVMTGQGFAQKPQAEPIIRQPTYALLDDVRRDLTAARVKNAGPFKDADTGLIKALESRLMDDQKAVVQKYGMLDTFNQARQSVALRKGIEDDLSALFGKNLDRSFVGGGEMGLPGAMRAVAAGDASRLVRLLNAVPQDMRQSVVSSGLSSVFRKAATRGELDFTGFAKWYEGLQRNRQAYNATMTNLPLSARKQLAALYKVSKGISDSLNARIKTGALNTVRDELLGKETLISNLYSLVKRGGVGAVAGTVLAPVAGPGVSAAVASALTKSKPAGMAAVDHLIASPEFLQLVKTASETPERRVAVKRVARSEAFRKLIKVSGASKEIRDPEFWIMQAMRPVPQEQQQQQRQDARQTIH